MLISFYLFIYLFFILYILLTVGVIPFKVLPFLINVDVDVDVDVLFILFDRSRLGVNNKL